jgi:hypothetical protein
MQQGKTEEVSEKMTFEQAATLYELKCEGWTYKQLAEVAGKSKETIRCLINDCLANGKDAKSLNPQRGTKPRIGIDVLRKAWELRDLGMCWKSIERKLGIDHAKLRFASKYHNDPMNRVRQRQKRAEQPR